MSGLDGRLRRVERYYPRERAPGPYPIKVVDAVWLAEFHRVFVELADPSRGVRAVLDQQRIEGETDGHGL